MKKSTLSGILLSCLFLSQTLFAQVTIFPWHEGFEGTTFPPANWTKYDIDNAGSQWDRFTGGAKTGNGAIYHSYSSGNQDGWLVSPKIAIPATKEYVLRFWSKNSYPGDYGKNSVLISTGSANPEAGDFTEIWSPPAVTTTWEEIVLNLSDNYAGEEIYIAFRYEGNYAHVWSLDDVSVEEFQEKDIAVVSITSPVSGNDLDAIEIVEVVIKNNGKSSITGFSLQLKVDGVVKATETYSGTIASLSQIEYIFATRANLSAGGEHTVEVTATLTGDGNTANNSVSTTVVNTIVAPISTFPWCEGFEETSFPINWKRYDLDNIGVRWERIVGGNVRTGDGAFYHSYSSGNQDGWLVSPKIIVPATKEYVLRFWSRNGDPGDYGKNSYDRTRHLLF